MEWLEEKEALWMRVAENMRVHFHCDDTTEMPNSSDKTSTVGSALSELKTSLASHDKRPFTYVRLKELIDLDDEVQKQYTGAQGPAYLQAIIRLTNVSSSQTVFDDFHYLLNKNPVSGIRSEPVSWIEEDVGALGEQDGFI